MLVGNVEKRQLVNFKWKHLVHRSVTGELIERRNMFLPDFMKFNPEVLDLKCVEPDFERKHITKYVHGHFADIDRPVKDPPDAFALAISYTNKAINAHKEGNYAKRDDYTGYMLHFFQDALCPVHTVFIPAPKDSPIRLFHKDFESVANSRMGKALSGIKLEEQTQYDSFETILHKAMRKTKGQYFQLKNNTENFKNVIDASLKNVYTTTDLYLKKLTSVFLKQDETEETMKLLVGK